MVFYTIPEPLWHNLKPALWVRWLMALKRQYSNSICLGLTVVCNTHIMEVSNNNISPCDKLQTSSICGQEIGLSVISDNESQKSTASWSEFDSAENKYANNIVKMEEGATYENPDQHEKTLKKQTEVLLISPLELIKFLKRPNEPPESYDWYPRLQDLMRGQHVPHSQPNGKSRIALFKNLLEDENAQSSCFWKTLCIILTITIIILIVLSYRHSKYIYYQYFP